MKFPKVLIIDDEVEFVSLLLKRLRQRGIACEGATSGGEGVLRLAGSDFDVVLLDMKLPDLPGNEVLRQIKELKPAVQVIILTGHVSAAAGHEGLQAGARDYLVKPVELESLLEKLLAAHAAGEQAA